jgi:cytochrome b involved in lipid metabolism
MLYWLVNETLIFVVGMVYNVTPYMDYHPGGWDELIKGAGMDATDIFNEVHSWVNYESMLSACLVGRLVDKEEGALNKIRRQTSANENAMPTPEANAMLTKSGKGRCS